MLFDVVNLYCCGAVNKVTAVWQYHVMLTNTKSEQYHVMLTNTMFDGNVCIQTFFNYTLDSKSGSETVSPFLVTQCSVFIKQ